MDIEFLAGKALWVRQQVMKMAYRANSGHLSTAFSQAEMLVALYYSGILQVDPKNPKWPERDRFILSKGQGGLGIYPILADLGFFGMEQLEWFLKKPGILGVHSENNIPGIELLTGSLGHGLPIATGITTALRLANNRAFVVVMLGDGELFEGSNWEAMFTASNLKLGHLVCIVDRNGGATIGHLEGDKPNDGPNQGQLEYKFKSFGFEVTEVDGHDFTEIVPKLGAIINREWPLEGPPVCIISETLKGKGIKAFEDGSIFPNHYFLVKGDDLVKALKDLSLDPNEFKAEVGGEYVGY